MNPLVYDPSWSKEKLWEEAKAYFYRAILSLRCPTPFIYPTAPPNPRRFGTGGRYFGLWVPPATIYVNVPAATNPPRVRGRVWSFPGHKTDRTVAGILAHEFGHHLTHYRKLDLKRWCGIVDCTKPVTSYEPTYDEALAESMRIFLLNPDLLRRARPLRYGYLADYFLPLHTQAWNVVLAKAPDFILNSAEKFTKEGSRQCKSLI